MLFKIGGVIKRRWRRALVLFVVGLVVVLVGIELFARYYVGLGNPPLTVQHPTIEYMFKPSQDIKRFGNRVLINEYGMRSASITTQKTDPDEFRILVLGDSVVNGGAQTDHEDLATTRLQELVQKQTNRPTRTLNVSAGSWGPANLSAYVEAFGTFDADVILLVVSGHDAYDVPRFTPLNPDSHPTRRPFSATTEGAFRYLPRYLPWTKPGQPAQPPTAREEELGRDAWRQLLVRLQATGAPVVIVFHRERVEVLDQSSLPGSGDIAAIAAELGVMLIDDRDVFASDIASGGNPYRDNIHPNRSGQTLLLGCLLQALESAELP